MRTKPAPESAARYPAKPLWPLAVPFVGLPLWWLLGLWQIMFFLMAGVMLMYLIRQRSIAMPRAFWIWLLWLAWLLTGLFVMQVHAPGTADRISAERYLVFAYRYGWYLAATIVALYIVNTRNSISTKRIVEAVSWFFVVLVAGGLLGLLAPNLSFDSLLQSALPRSLANFSLVNELTHVQSAQMHSVLGTPQPRPSAPFIYTNGWGFATAIALPLFVVAWWSRGRLWRVAMTFVLILALVPIILSLNRGTWIAILSGVLLAIVHSVAHGRIKALIFGAVGALLAICLVLFSPLGDMVSARIANGHSDEGRENLSTAAIQSTIEGSPVVGFGTTRDVAGNFSSIARGASEACPNCSPPPVGTHGQLWLTTFGAGFIGAALYVGFILTQFIGGFRLRSPYAIAALCSISTLLVTLPIYNAVGVPLFIGFIAVGVIAREQDRSLPILHETLRPVFRHAPVLILVIGLGALTGYGLNSVRGMPVAATQRVLVPSAEFGPVPGIRPATLDAEAVLVRSSSVLNAVAAELNLSKKEVRSGLEVGAEPNTRVLLVTFKTVDADKARRGVETAVDAFIAEREQLLAEQTTALIERYQARQEKLDTIYQQTRAFAQLARSSFLWSTMTSLSREWGGASNILADAELPSQATVISSPSVAVFEDARTVRVATGAGLGGLFGLLVVLAHDRRGTRLGKRADGHIRLGAPVVARCLGEDVSTAVHAARTYWPLAGVIADCERPTAVALAKKLDAELVRSDYGGVRALVVVDSRTRVHHARQMIRAISQGGIDPVGLVLHVPTQRFLRRKRGTQ